MLYPIISYTLHLAVCFSMGLCLWFYRGTGHGSGSSYRDFLRTLSVIFFLNAIIDPILIYLYAEGIDDSFLNEFISPFFVFLTSGLVFRPFLYHLRSNTKMARLQDVMTMVFVFIGLVHPIQYYQYRIRTHYDYGFSISSYKEFLTTPECEVLVVILYLVGTLYILLCFFNMFRHLRTIYLWNRQHKGERVYALSLKMFCLVSFSIALMIVDSALYEFYGPPYYMDLPVWSLYGLVVAVGAINCQQEYVRLERESIRMQIDLVGSKMFYNKSVLDLSEEENIHRREQTVVLRAINEWSARDDRPYLDKNLTISTLSDEIGIPATIIIRNLNLSYGLSFDEYINYLHKKSIDNMTVNKIL